MRSRRGFTLVELIVLISIMALLVVVSIPAIGNYVRSNRLSTQVDMMAADLKMARSTSIANGDILLLVADPTGYQIWNTSTGTTVVQRQFEGTVQMQGNLFVNFFPWGMSDPGVVTLESGDRPTRQINILPTGIIEVD